MPCYYNNISAVTEYDAIISIISIIASASADVSGDKSAAKYSEMSAILGFLGHIWPPPLLEHSKPF